VLELQRARLQGQAQARLLAGPALAASMPDEARPAAATGPAAGTEPAVAVELQPLLEQAQQRRKPLAVAALEVENASALAARFGAAVVDAVFRDIAQRVRMRLRPRDLSLRLNHHSWLVVLTDTPPAAAAAICERLRSAVEQEEWRAIADGLRLNLCLGLVTGVTDTDVGLVLQRAETALRRARQGGSRRTVGA
jgi:diguanylate cyclase (GGDEF)-like protein